MNRSDLLSAVLVIFSTAALVILSMAMMTEMVLRRIFAARVGKAVGLKAKDALVAVKIAEEEKNNG